MKRRKTPARLSSISSAPLLRHLYVSFRLCKVAGDSAIIPTYSAAGSTKQGEPRAVQFEEARFGRLLYEVDIMPYQYRAVKVIIDISWSNKFEVWHGRVLVC
jgi:hypothetical protein